MELALRGFNDNGESTLGLIFCDGLFECYSLEDQQQLVKVPGETRIPDGRYEIKFREVESGLTRRYRAKFPWFTWHIELQDVPDFQYVYLHVGNDRDDTDACILVGDTANNNQIHKGFVGQSTPAYQRLYLKISKALVAGEKVYIDVRRDGRFDAVSGKTKRVKCNG